MGTQIITGVRQKLNRELTGALFTFTLAMLILNSQCKECARDPSNGTDSTRPKNLLAKTVRRQGNLTRPKEPWVSQ